MDELQLISFAVGLVIGVLWSLIGLHVLDWLSDKHTPALSRILGDAAYSRGGWIIGSLFVVLWPLGVAVVLLAEQALADES